MREILVEDLFKEMETKTEQIDRLMKEQGIPDDIALAFLPTLSISSPLKRTAEAQFTLESGNVSAHHSGHCNILKRIEIIYSQVMFSSTQNSRCKFQQINCHQ